MSKKMLFYTITLSEPAVDCSSSEVLARLRQTEILYNIKKFLTKTKKIAPFGTISFRVLSGITCVQQIYPLPQTFRCHPLRH